MYAKQNESEENKASCLKQGSKMKWVGGFTWVFFGWVCAAQDSKLAPCSKKNFS